MEYKKPFVPHSNLKLKYYARFFCCGLKLIFTDWRSQMNSLFFVFTVALILHFMRFSTGSLALMFTFLYRLTVLAIAGIVATIMVITMGAPREYLRITQQLERVNGLFNADGESAILISRVPKEDGKTEVWTFDAYGLPLSLFEDLRDAIESALDIAIIIIEGGEDAHKVVLTVLPHPGPWPQLIHWQDSYLSKRPSELVLGENRTERISVDLDERAHLLINGQTGSGKTVLMQSLMYQLLVKKHEVILVDYKRGVDYGPAWEAFCDLIVEDEAFLHKLEWLSTEMDRRYDLLRKTGYPGISQYNALSGEQFPHIVLFVDELAECLDKTSVSKERKERIDCISYQLSRLCRLGRAAGINCILSTQRGSSDYLSGQIRNNCYKIVGRCDENLSLLTIGCTDAAKKLLYQGQFMNEYKTVFQGYYADYSNLLSDRQGDCPP